MTISSTNEDFATILIAQFSKQIRGLVERVPLSTINQKTLSSQEKDDMIKQVSSVLASSSKQANLKNKNNLVSTNAMNLPKKKRGRKPLPRNENNKIIRLPRPN